MSDAWTGERTGRAQSTGPAPGTPPTRRPRCRHRPPASPTRLLPVAQAAEQLSTTASTLYELVASYAVPSVRIGRAIRIPAAALHRLQNEPAEYLAQPDRVADRRSIGTAQPQDGPTLTSIAPVCSTSTRVVVPPISISGRNEAARAAAEVGATSTVDSRRRASDCMMTPVAHPPRGDGGGSPGASYTPGLTRRVEPPERTCAMCRTSPVTPTRRPPCATTATVTASTVTPPTRSLSTSPAPSSYSGRCAQHDGAPLRGDVECLVLTSAVLPVAVLLVATGLPAAAANLVSVSSRPRIVPRRALRTGNSGCRLLGSGGQPLGTVLRCTSPGGPTCSIRQSASACEGDAGDRRGRLGDPTLVIRLSWNHGAMVSGRRSGRG